MPKVFVREILDGQEHAAQANTSGDFIRSQAGVWDRNVLCSSCDGLLGKLEDYAATSFSRLRAECVGKVEQFCELADVDCHRILRFYAGLLWKYSVTEKQFGRINLGPYQDVLRGIAFANDAAPPSFDVALFRPTRGPDDDRVFAYRAPMPDRKHGVNCFRVLVGGMIAIIKVDKRILKEDNIGELWIASRHGIKCYVKPAHHFEEYRVAKAIVQESTPVGRFLDKQAAKSAVARGSV